MNKYLSTLIIIIPLYFLLSCVGRKETFETNHQLRSLGRPNKIEFYYHQEGQAFQYQTNPEFVIAEEREIEAAMKEIRNADNPEPWKGAGWDRIIIKYDDTVIKINTDTKKIGLSVEGSFYNLNKDNFITKRLDEDKIEYNNKLKNDQFNKQDTTH